MEKNERKAVSKIAVITAAALLTVFAITIHSFMVTGGILLFIVSIELLTHGAWRFGGGTRREAADESE
jgi:multiple antibiotic resistance protein